MSYFSFAIETLQLMISYRWYLLGRFLLLYKWLGKLLDSDLLIIISQIVILIIVECSFEIIVFVSTSRNPTEFYAHWPSLIIFTGW